MELRGVDSATATDTATPAWTMLFVIVQSLVVGFMLAHFVVQSELGHLLSRDTPSFRDAVDPQDVLAFVHRNELFLLQHTVIVDPDTSIAEREAARRWLEQSWGMVHPWGSGGVYPNWPDPDLEDWEHAYHGANYDRLVSVKGKRQSEVRSGRILQLPPIDPESRSGKRCIDLKARRYVWEQAYDAERYIRVLSSYSGHRSLGPV
jgi:hypothetical protein